MNIGDKLKFYRNENKITQKQISEILEINIRTYQKYESGEITPSIDTLNKISKAFNIPITVFTDNEETELYNKLLNDNNSKNDFLVRKLRDIVFNNKTSNLKPILYTTKQHKIELCETIEEYELDLCKMILDSFGYTVEFDNDVVKISDDSRVYKFIKVDLRDFIVFSKNIHWALDGFIDKFINENSSVFKEGDQENGE